MFREIRIFTFFKTYSGMKIFQRTLTGNMITVGVEPADTTEIDIKSSRQERNPSRLPMSYL